MRRSPSGNPQTLAPPQSRTWRRVDDSGIRGPLAQPPPRPCRIPPTEREPADVSRPEPRLERSPNPSPVSARITAIAMKQVSRAGSSRDLLIANLETRGANPTVPASAPVPGHPIVAEALAGERLAWMTDAIVKAGLHSSGCRRARTSRKERQSHRCVGYQGWPDSPARGSIWCGCRDRALGRWQNSCRRGLAGSSSG